jgi:hypothetical protein
MALCGAFFCNQGFSPATNAIEMIKTLLRGVDTSVMSKQRSRECHLVVLVLNREVGVSAEPDRGDTMIARGKPKLVYLAVHLFDLCLPDPE